MSEIRPHPGERTFNVHIESDMALTVNEIWPDGDAPFNPTTEDVVRVMEAAGSKRSVLRDWELLQDVTVDVDGLGVWRPGYVRPGTDR